jgi:hypothetical protein
MKEIQLSNSELKVKVDDEAYEHLLGLSWRLNQGYAVHGGGGSGPTILMHRVVLPTRYPLIVDHIDRNGLNNQRDNLRAVDRRENLLNSSTFSGGFSSNFKGVCWNGARGRWLAYYYEKRKRVDLGWFRAELDAAAALKRIGK